MLTHATRLKPFNQHHVHDLYWHRKTWSNTQCNTSLLVQDQIHRSNHVTEPTLSILPTLQIKQYIPFCKCFGSIELRWRWCQHYKNPKLESYMKYHDTPIECWENVATNSLPAQLHGKTGLLKYKLNTPRLSSSRFYGNMENNQYSSIRSKDYVCRVSARRRDVQLFQDYCRILV